MVGQGIVTYVGSSVVPADSVPIFRADPGLTSGLLYYITGVPPLTGLGCGDSLGLRHQRVDGGRRGNQGLRPVFNLELYAALKRRSSTGLLSFALRVGVIGRSMLGDSSRGIIMVRAAGSVSR